MQRAARQRKLSAGRRDDHQRSYQYDGRKPHARENVPEFGDRFFDVSDMYSASLREIARECAQRSRLTVHEGVYEYFCGPQFETPAEIRAAPHTGGGRSRYVHRDGGADCGALQNAAIGTVADHQTWRRVAKSPDHGRRSGRYGAARVEAFQSYVRDIIRHL